MSQAPGKLIVIDGTDGSGKATQARLLAQRLRKEGQRVEEVSFPTYGTMSCKGVELYLNGALGSPEEVGPYYASMLYAYNRAKEMERLAPLLTHGMHLVVNRYASANAGHQGGKIKDPAARERFLRWAHELEFGIFGIPQPDLTILLHVPPAIGQALVARKEKSERTYLTEGKEKDIHEADLAHLRDAESAYLAAARKLPGWTIVECVREGALDQGEHLDPERTLRTVEEIHEEVYARVKGLLVR